MLISWAYKKYKAKKQAKEEQKRVAAGGPGASSSEQPASDGQDENRSRSSLEREQAKS
ncbi:hypothetical protein PAXINDRAFT_167176 [Paxillus involutus ATCC 200175]|nr:hypothetical protein PAXINDRAFT_167176 [Paxillus involutus ATCC 200175]